MIYFTSRNIPTLQGLKFTQRADIIKIALSYLSTPQKTILNILKLLIITPLFLVLASVDSWYVLLYLIGVGLSYPLITNPLSYHFIRNNVEKAKDDYFKNKSPL
ncbi:DUF6170 family protein [Pseudoalteromonas tunicata]|uniref:DUF6170 family protein n=1 Tax=Pseudoalteromonas tunicata TaxID=314281 RepID=UPI00273F1AB3|nr:DUF6170 family protein [Pseudoalteromonas tunicata]MDP4982781.1 DUF6170 family protein [Pseudoalteromonas tunicata]